MRTAIYTRFSSDRQSDTSTDAQERLCRARAGALGLTVVAVHSDAAVSGATPVDARPGGRALLADALASRIDVLLLEGLDRLSRDIGDQDRVVKRLEHRGIRIVGVSDGYDSGAKGRKIMRVARGLISELYLDDLRDKTHRSLAAKAARGAHVTGLSYGYRSVPAGDDKRLEVVPEQAEVVREIFRRYAAGETLKAITSDLNRRDVPGPRGRGWALTALYGSPAKGAGILNNELYIGRYVWNRSQWVKDPDTGRRQRIDRPPAEWLSREAPELAIVDRATWDAVRRRIGTPGPRATLRKGGHLRTLLGGLLRCGRCGAPIVAVNGSQYGCAAHRDRGESACAGIWAPRRQTDERVLSALRDQLAAPVAIAQVRRTATERLRDAAGAARQTQERIARVDREIANLTDAVAAVGLSDALRARLAQAEAARQALARETPATLPTPDDVVRHYRAGLLQLRTALAEDVGRARAALEEALGAVTVSEREGEVWAEAETKTPAMLVAGGRSLGLVAGACFGAQLRVRIA